MKSPKFYPTLLCWHSTIIIFCFCIMTPYQLERSEEPDAGISCSAYIKFMLDSGKYPALPQGQAFSVVSFRMVSCTQWKCYEYVIFSYIDLRHELNLKYCSASHFITTSTIIGSSVFMLSLIFFAISCFFP